MPKRVTAEKKAECIRLRIREQLSTPRIARKVGLSNASVYKALQKHPWLGVRQDRRSWSTEEVRKLIDLWPVADDDDLLKEFPKRNLGSIGRKASDLGVRRPLPGARKNKRFIHPIFKALRAERERRKLTRAALATKAGHHVNQIQTWENGKCRPLFLALLDWAAALGMEIVLRPIGGDNFDAGPQLPTKAQMMGRR